MMATICGRFHLELDPQMGGEAGVLERQISSFTLAVDGGLFIQFHDRTQVGPSLIPDAASFDYLVTSDEIGPGGRPSSYHNLETICWQCHLSRC